MTKGATMKRQQTQRKRWQCNFCEVTCTTPEECRDHEHGCDYNPTNKTCETCGHQDTSEAQIRRQMCTGGKRKCAVLGMVDYHWECEHHVCPSNKETANSEANG